MSSATNEVATLRRGILNTFDIMLNMHIDIPADAKSNAPFKKFNFKSEALEAVDQGPC